MAKEKTRMKCPACGAEMNHHAYKVDFPAGLREPGGVDKDLGGIVEEFHACPKCGNSATRKAE